MIARDTVCCEVLPRHGPSHQAQKIIQTMVLSEALVNAAKEGDVAAGQDWLDAGGNPDETAGIGGATLLDHIASAHDTDSQFYDPECCGAETP